MAPPSLLSCGCTSASASTAIASSTTTTSAPTRRLPRQPTASTSSQYNLDGYFREKDPPLLVFSHFAGGIGDKVYNRVPSLDRLRQILEESLNEYNEENARMDQVSV